MRSQVDCELQSQKSEASYRNHGFSSLAKNEEDEQELDSFFGAERQYMILTNAGKPVFSL
jgi:hypothetical protein